MTTNKLTIWILASLCMLVIASCGNDREKLSKALVKYDDFGSFENGLARVEKDGKWGVIDITGKEIIPCVYDYDSEWERNRNRNRNREMYYAYIGNLGNMYMTVYSEGLTPVKKDDKWGFVDKKGKEVVPCFYDGLFPFTEGLAIVIKDSKCGVIDKTGKEVVPCIYNGLLPFSEGLAIVIKDSKCGVIDKTGKEVVPCIYNGLLPFSEGLAIIVKDDKGGFIDKTGNEVVPCIYDDLLPFSEGLAMVVKDGKVGFIDKTGNEVVSCFYDYNHSSIYPGFSEGLAMVVKDGKVGFIDKTGNEVISCIYNETGVFHEGFAQVQKGGKWGLIDKTGKEVVFCIYDEIEDFSEELARVKKGYKFGFINKTGKRVVPCIYDMADDFSEGLARVEKDGKYRFVDKTGKEVFRCAFDRAESFSDGFARVNLKNQEGYIDKEGYFVGKGVVEEIPRLKNVVSNVAKDEYYERQQASEPVEIPEISKIPDASAQYCIPFITLDPDKYTNIREEPNSNSTIVDRVYEYEVFCFIGTNLSNYDESNWIPVSTDQVIGYIYKKHILQLDKLPSLAIRQKLHDNSTTHGVLLNSNDTLSVTMNIAPFDKNKHELEVTNDSYGEHVRSIDGKDFYGTRMPVREIQSIEILCKGRKTVLPNERIKRLYNPHTMHVHIGRSGELYLNICGGGDDGQYAVWFSIVDGNIAYELDRQQASASSPEISQVPDEVDEIIPFAVVEEKPKFQGKDAGEFVKWINTKLANNYPKAAIEQNLQGTVRVSFTINIDGTLSDIKSLRKVDPILEECVIELVKKSPKWTPGRQKNKPVKVTYQIPVIFKLQ